MADQKINELPVKSEPTTGDKVLMIGASEEYQIDYDQLATAILNKLTSKTFTLDQGTKTLVAALNELNSNIKLEGVNGGKTYNLDNLTSGSNIVVYTGIDTGINEGDPLPAEKMRIAISISGFQIIVGENGYYVRYYWGNWKQWEKLL